MPPSLRARWFALAALLLFTISSACSQTGGLSLTPPSVRIDSFELVSERVLAPTVTESTYRATCRTDTGPFDDAVAFVSAPDLPVQLVDATLRCGRLAKGAVKRTVDTIVLQRDPARPFDPNTLAWITLAWGPGSLVSTETEASGARRLRYEVEFTNGTGKVQAVAAGVSSNAGNTTVLDGLVTAAAQRNGAVRTGDAFEVRVAAGATLDPASLIWTLSVGARSEFALGVVRTLDGLGQPLGDVAVEEHGPAGLVLRSSEPLSGIATLAEQAGSFQWRFEKDGHLPVWREGTLAAGQVLLVPSPWLARRSDARVTLSVLNGGDVGDGAPATVHFAGGAFAAGADATLSALDGQTLPGPLPPGWSPLAAFWLETSVEPVQPGDAELRLSDRLAPGERAFLIRFDEPSLRWIETGTPVAASGDAATTTLAASGAYAVVVPDVGATAPPTPVAGQPLPPSATPFPLPDALAAQGSVVPPVAPASLDPVAITAQAEIVVSHPGLLPSGFVLRGDVDERYDLRDGTSRTAPSYETFFTAYQRPGDDDPHTLHARFPLRPQVAIGPDELDEALVHLEILPVSAFEGGFFDASGGRVGTAGLLVSAPPGAVASARVVEVRGLDTSRFADLAPQGALRFAFELAADGLLPGARLGLGFGPQEPDANFVVARFVHSGSRSGLEPRARFASDAGGVLRSVEPTSGERLPGVTGSGQYVLVRVDAPQALVQGVARDSAGQPAAGLAVEIEGEPWLTFSAADGHFALVATPGQPTLVVTDLRNGDRGTQSVALADSTSVANVDLGTGPSGPRVVLLDPADGATGVRRSAPIRIVFSERVATLGPRDILLFDSAGVEVPVVLTMNLARTEATLLPVNPLDANETHRIALEPTIADPGGLPLEGPREFGFTTVALADRGAGAELISWEPGADTSACDTVPGFDPDDDGISCVIGSAGAADPDVPVIVINDTRGTTATVRSDVDGSFETFLDADVDDSISATFVNGNGTRITLPLSRQNFDDGSVALFPGGGILEAESDGGPVQVIVEPGAIPSKAKFKLDLADTAQILQDLLAKAPPENGAKLLGAVNLSVEGEVREAIDVTFPVDPAALDLPPGQTAEQQDYVITQPIEVDGSTVYSVLDTAHFADGAIRTASPPYDGLLGPTGLLVALLFPFPPNASTNVTVTGRVGVVSEALGRPPTDSEVVDGIAANFPISPVFGAVVSATPAGQALAGDRLRPGAFVATSNRAGFYALRVPVIGADADAVGMRASSTRFPGRIAYTQFPVLAAAGLGTAGVINANMAFVVPAGSEGGIDQLAPVITPNPGQTVLPVGTAFEIPFVLRDDRTAPSIVSATLVADQSGSLIAGEDLGNVDIDLGANDATSPTTALGHVSVTVERDAVVTLLITATDAAGNQTARPFTFRFGTDFADVPPGALEPSDPDDATPPSVISIVPVDGALVEALDSIVVRFSEAVQDDFGQFGALSLMSSDGGSIQPDYELSPDHLELRIDPGALLGGVEYTLTLGSAVRDLKGNALADTVSSSFRTTPTAGGGLPDVKTPVATVMKGNIAYTLDRGTGQNDEGIYIHRVDDPANPVLLGSFLQLPDFPRSLAIVPKWSYKQTLTGATRTDRTLLIAAGGLLGSDQVGQWIQVIDATDPAAPERVASLLTIPDFTAAIGLLRASAPRFYVLVNAGEGGTISQVNLQSFILGCNMSSDEFQHNAHTPGLDDDRNGDYVGPNDALPIPERLTLFGIESTFIAPPFRLFTDFDVADGGSTFAAILDREKNNSLPPGTGAPPRYQTILFGGSFIGDGSAPDGGVEYAADPRPFRVRLDLDLPTTDAAGNTKIIPAALVVRGDTIEVIDLTDPANPVKIADVGFGDALADGKKIFALERSGSQWVVATDDKIFFLDRARLTQPPAQTGQPSPAITNAIDTAFSGRTFGASESGVVVPGANRIAQLPPKIEVVQVVTKPVTDSIGILQLDPEGIEDFVFGGVEASALLPAPLRASGGVPSVLTTPLVPQLHYYVRIRGSGAMGNEIPIAIEALDRNGKPLSAQGEFFPPIFVSGKAAAVGLVPPLQRTETPLLAHRMSNDTSSDLYNFYMSDPFVIVREAVTETDQTDFDQAGVLRRMVRSGEMIRVSIDAQDGQQPILDDLEGKVVDGVYQPGLSRTYTALCSDYVDSPNPSFESAAPRLAGVTMSSGEYRHEAGDLVVPGRLQDLVMTRVYESRSATSGPLGPGFDFNWNARICELPVTSVPAGFKLPITDYGNAGADRVATAGDVLYVDGSGSVHLYRRIDAQHGNLAEKTHFDSDPAIAAFDWTGKIGSFYQSPVDRFDAMYRFTDGSFVLLSSDGTRTLFDGAGRLTDLIPPFVDGRFHLAYRQSGKLARVEGDRGIALEFGYRGATTSPDFVNALDLPFSGPGDLGRLARVKAGPKNVEYRYDDHGRLERVIKTHGRDMRYGWDPAAPTLLASHGFGSGGNEEPRAAIEYSDGLVIGVTVRGQHIDFGGAVHTAAERFASNGGSASAKIGASPVQEYPFDRFGAATQLGGAPVSADDSGRLGEVADVGVHGSMTYDDQNSVWRFRGNLLQAQRDGFTTQMTYDGSAWNRLQSLTTPENVVTSYSFNPVAMTDVVSSGFEITETRGPVVRKVTMNRNGQFVAEKLDETGATAITRGVKHDFSSDLPNSAVYGNTYPTASGSLFAIDIGAAEDGPTSFTNGLQGFTVTRDSTGKATGLGGAASYGITEDNGRPGKESFSSGSFSVEESLTWATDDPFTVKSMTDKVSGLGDLGTTYSYGTHGQVGGWVTNGETTAIGYQGSIATTLSAPGISQELGGFQSGLPTTLTDQGISAQLGFDALGRFESITTDLGTTTLGYGAGHRVVSKSIDDPVFGTLFSESYGYDAAGRMDSISGAVDTQIHYFPDSEIREIQVGGQTVRRVERDEAGRVTRIELPQLGSTFERTGFDAASARATGETLSFTTGRTITNNFGYDGTGRLQTQTLVGAGSWTYGYDAMGRRTSTTDPDGVVSGSAFAADGTLLSLHFGDGTVADYHYDTNRHLDGVGDIQLTLDGEKLVHVITWPDGTTTQFDRTTNPFQVDQIEHGGVTQFIDRVAGQPRGISIPNSGDSLVYERDALGAIRSATHNGRHIDVGYDAVGRVTSETTDLGTWSVSFDAQGHLLTETYPSGFGLAYTPDAQGQPTAIPAAGISGITFAAPGEVESFDYAGGVSLRREFDAAMRVTALRWEIPNPDPTAAPISVAGFEYGLTPGGRVNFEHSLHGQRFDVFTRNAPAESMRIVDFALGATSQSGAGAEVALQGFSFDGDGELLAPTASSGAPDSRAFFPELIVSGSLQQADGVAILYDDGGAVMQTPLWVRLPGQGAPTRVVATLEHDGLGMLKRVVRDDGCEIEYERDAYGRIVARKVTGPADRCRAGKQRFAWQGQHLIEEYEESGSPFQPTLDLVRRYVWIGNRLALLQAASAPGAALVDFIPLANASNSVGGYLAPNGTWLESVTYGPYGMPVFRSVASGVPLAGEAETSAIASRLLFHGAFYDDATGLYQMGERTLHPLLGRFLERDSQLYRESRALLTAFNGDPASRTDGTGALSEPTRANAEKVKAALTTNVDNAKSLGQSILAASGGQNDWRSPFDIGIATTKMVSSVASTASAIGGQEVWAKSAKDYVGDVDVLAKGLSAMKSVFEIERETAVLDATRAIALRPSHAGYFGETLQSGGGLAAIASLHGVENSDAVASARTIARNEGAEAAAAHYYKTAKDAQGKLLAGRLAAAQGVLAFARSALKSQLEADKDAATTPIDAMDKSPAALNSSGLLDMSEGLLGGAKAILDAQKLMGMSEAAKIASAVEGGSFMSRVLPEYAIAKGVFEASYKFTQGAILVLGDEYLANAYRQAVRRFGEDGKMLTVASGMLAAAYDLTGIQFFQNEAWSIQNFQDRTAIPSQGPFAREVQANQQRMNQIIRGLDIDDPNAP